MSAKDLTQPLLHAGLVAVALAPAHDVGGLGVGCGTGLEQRDDPAVRSPLDDNLDIRVRGARYFDDAPDAAPPGPEGKPALPRVFLELAHR